MNRIVTTLIALFLATSLVGCSAVRLSEGDSRALAAEIDIAIITVLPEEYDAVLRKLENVRPVMEPGGHTNVYLWATGEIRSVERKEPHRLVVAMAGQAGEVSGALVTKATIDRWNPRDVLLVGIAGGLQDSVALGDIVISSQIWGYEHGHLGTRYDSGGLHFFQSDPALVRAALDLGPEWKRRIENPAPDRGQVPNVVVGKTASGNKVIENASSAYFAQSVHLDGTIVSVEMEGAGAAAAIGRDHDMGGTTGFLMIRGISDLIEKVDEEGRNLAERGRNPQRDVWKSYAADVAASFAAALIETNWPD